MRAAIVSGPISAAVPVMEPTGQGRAQITPRRLSPVARPLHWIVASIAVWANWHDAYRPSMAETAPIGSLCRSELMTAVAARCAPL